MADKWNLRCKTMFALLKKQGVETRYENEDTIKTTTNSTQTEQPVSG